MNPSGSKEKKEQRIRVGITHGDFNGIGYEVILRTLLDQRHLESFTPVIYGSSKVASYYRKTLGITDINLNLVKKAEYANQNRINIVNIFDREVKIELGRISPVAGELAYYALEQATQDLKNNYIDVLVTAPINKRAIQSDKFNFPGHTEYLSQTFDTDDNLMLMVSGELRIGVMTGHIPLKDVPGKLTSELIINKINLMNQTLKRDFGVLRPKIAVLGLNPHAGDMGLIGKEEHDIMSPAIEKCNDQNILVFGPFSSDGFFGSSNYTKFDAVLACYHDQGLIPFKNLAFDTGVNFTAGLPIVRTSPAHGTAFEIAGKNKASIDSFRNSVYLAIDIFRTRSLNDSLVENQVKEEKPTENDTVDEKETD